MYYLNFLPEMLHGIFITCILMLGSVGIGLTCAILLTFSRYLGNIWVKKSIDGLIFFITGTPLLVQIFLLYFGLSQFEWLRESVFWILIRDPMSCAIIALALNTACYTSVLFTGAIRSVPQNEVLACTALGMSNSLALRRIIFPRAFRLAIPAYSNELVMMLKNTSLASTITLLDIMGVTQKIISETYQPLQWYIFAGIIYLLLHTMILSSFHLLTRHLSMIRECNT